MKLYLEFEPCKECRTIINEITENPNEMQTQKNSVKFLRHITYNHSEIVQAVIKEVPIQKKKEEFNWFR